MFYKDWIEKGVWSIVYFMDEEVNLTWILLLNSVLYAMTKMYVFLLLLNQEYYGSQPNWILNDSKKINRIISPLGLGYIKSEIPQPLA